MNWNFSLDGWEVRLPVTDQDGDALFELMSSGHRLEHIPKQPLVASVQALDELRRMNMRFQAHQAAFWLVFDVDQSLRAMISLEEINWIQSTARLQWIADETFDLEALKACLWPIQKLIFEELELNRLEVRLKATDGQAVEELTALGFQHEGYLPAQIEFEGLSVDLQIWSLLATDIG
ncbi:MAG: GNAT family N-acetyltransferase [Oceanobacter sp.]